MAETILISFIMSPEKCATTLRRAVNQAMPGIAPSFARRIRHAILRFMQEGWIFRIAAATLPAALCAIWLPSCSAHEVPVQRPAAPPQLSSDASLMGRTFETLGACEHLKPDSLGEQAFAAYLRRHAPFADAATVRSLRTAYERGTSPAVAARQTPKTCAQAMRDLTQEAPRPARTPR